MQTIEIARKLLALGENAEAVKAYKLALNEYHNQNPAVELECAVNILQFGAADDYKFSFTSFVDLYNRGYAQADIMQLMNLAFYQPNVKTLKNRYKKNCRLLKKYPYIFRRDFPKFEALPLLFYPYADDQYVPYDLNKQSFGEFLALQRQVVSRNFFADLAKPIMAADVFSQYELEYLVDNVRKSEYVGKENHIYLHYTDWHVFCAYLQLWDLAAILKDEKVVFLIEDEIGQYPIDFQKRFGIDYSQYAVQPLHIREINRLIWHVQLSAHNGGDFFNEIFDAHPNLLARPSIMFDKMEETIASYKEALDQLGSIKGTYVFKVNSAHFQELYALPDRTDKDVMVAAYLDSLEQTSPYMDAAARIAPAIFFQPHFGNIFYDLEVYDKKNTVLQSKQFEKIDQAEFLRGFKYIKTFTPMRRITTSYGAAVKFKLQKWHENENKSFDDALLNRVLNRSFMIDWQDRFFMDSRLVRFEDAKLNPKATFRALAAFLDLPYTESMTYCSEYGEINPESLPGNDIGFSTAALYRTYDDYTNDAERAFIEYFMRDAYEYYGYDFHYYQGQPVDYVQALAWVRNFAKIDYFIRQGVARQIVKQSAAGQAADGLSTAVEDKQIEQHMQKIDEMRLRTVRILLRSLNFVNKNGQPLHMMPKLELDPALLEQPLYH